MDIKKLVSAVAAVFSVSSTAIASGDSPGQRYFSPSIAYVIADDERIADDGGAIQLGIGQVISKRWNIELYVSAEELDRTNTAGKYQQQGIGIDGLYFLSRGERFSPYGLVGVGGLRTRIPGNVNAGIMPSVGAGVMTSMTDAGTALLSMPTVAIYRPMAIGIMLVTSATNAWTPHPGFVWMRMDARWMPTPMAW
jgi:OOP family OmpA-OmpF porin